MTKHEVKGKFAKRLEEVAGDAGFDGRIDRSCSTTEEMRKFDGWRMTSLV